MSSLRSNINHGFHRERINELLDRTNEFASTSTIYDTNELFVTMVPMVRTFSVSVNSEQRFESLNINK